MSAVRVDAVIAAVEQSDPELARRMHIAADGLTAGEGEERITAARSHSCSGPTDCLAWTSEAVELREAATPT